MLSPYQVTKDFEAALCSYTGARYAVAVNSGTAALMLSLMWCDRHEIQRPITGVNIPRRTYVSVPCAVKLAGCVPAWRDEDWFGVYQLKPYPVWDSACSFTSGMYRDGQFQCVSFAARKILGSEQGGAILHDNAEADAWFRRMRFDGRTEDVAVEDDTFDVVGHHCILIPSVAATLLLRLYHLPQHNDDIGCAADYPDISGHPAWL